MLLPVSILVIGQSATVPATPGSQPSTGFSISSSKPLVGVRPTAFAVAPVGNKVALALEDGTIRIIDAATRQTVKTMTGHRRQPLAIAWSPDGRWIATGDDSARIYLWDTKTWTKAKEIVGHTRPIQALGFNAASTELISTGQDDVVKIWTLADMKKERMSLQGGGANLYGARFIGKSNDFAMGTLQQGARLYTAQKTMRGWLSGHGSQGVLAVDFNPLATRAVTAGRDNNAGLYDVKTMQRLGYFKGHEDWVMNVAYSPNGKFVATSSSDRTVRVWNPNNFAQVVKLDDQKGVGSPLGFTADGKYMITVDLSDNVVVHTLNPPQAPTPAAAIKAPAKGASKPVKRKRGG
jgi:WD40 repeat protein